MFIYLKIRNYLLLTFFTTIRCFSRLWKSPDILKSKPGVKFYYYEAASPVPSVSLPWGGRRNIKSNVTLLIGVGIGRSFAYGLMAGMLYPLAGSLLIMKLHSKIYLTSIHFLKLVIIFNDSFLFYRYYYWFYFPHFSQNFHVEMLLDCKFRILLV